MLEYWPRQIELEKLLKGKLHDIRWYLHSSGCLSAGPTMWCNEYEVNVIPCAVALDYVIRLASAGTPPSLQTVLPDFTIFDSRPHLQRLVSRIVRKIISEFRIRQTRQQSSHHQDSQDLLSGDALIHLDFCKERPAVTLDCPIQQLSLQPLLDLERRRRRTLLPACQPWPPRSPAGP